ncbi:hypothetical protein Tco_0501478, partial [Tanacetum coccineum]
FEEQPLPHVDSPTAESPGYIAESDPEEDPEYEDDEEQDVVRETMTAIHLRMTPMMRMRIWRRMMRMRKRRRRRRLRPTPPLLYL